MQFLEDGPVIVVGAGLSGLTAAWRLRQSGREVVVLEAADRIGGRTIQSAEQWADGQYAELGGELVDASYHSFRGLCDEVGVELLEPQVYGRREPEDASVMEGYLRASTFVIDGRLLTDHERSAAGQELRKAARDSAPQAGEIVEQWVRRASLSNLAAGVTRAVARMLTQLEPWDCDVHYVFGPQDGKFQRVRGGTQMLTTELARDLDVRCADPVVRIERGRTVRVTTQSGLEFWGSDVVCAVGPFAVSAIGFDPPLSDERVMTATSLLPAMGGKVVAQYEEGDAVRDGFGSLVSTDGVINAAWVTSPEVTSGPAIVTSLFSGAERNVMTDKEAAFEKLDGLVERVCGARLTRTQGEVKNWWADPLHLSVTVAPAELTRGTVEAVLGGEDFVSHFAGDYTNAAMCGTLEGAVRSGLRVAEEILRASPSLLTDYVTGRLSIS